MAHNFLLLARKTLLLGATILMSLSLAWGQSTTLPLGKGIIGYAGIQAVPANVKSVPLAFHYRDTPTEPNLLADTISAAYQVEDQSFLWGLGIGVGYQFNEGFSLMLNGLAHFQSFASNQQKNGKAYGGQVEIYPIWSVPLSPRSSIQGKVGFGYAFGGFGITSDGPKNKEYLQVREERLFDPDIGFHIIDRSLLLSGLIGWRYQLAPRTFLLVEVGYQHTFGRSSYLNIAGLDQGGDVRWNRIDWDDDSQELRFDGEAIDLENAANLPYNFRGLRWSLGVVVWWPSD